MKVPSKEIKSWWLSVRIPTTEKQVQEFERKHPPETWKELPESLKDPLEILKRGKVKIREGISTNELMEFL